MVLVDLTVLKKQFAYLRKLRGMRSRTLARLHEKKFKGTKWYVEVPRWFHRSIMERRLFFYYCAKNYHYPDSHPITREFRRKAAHILSKQYIADIKPEEYSRKRLRELSLFTRANIDAMSINEVDRYLASLGLFIHSDEEHRRKVLWEWFNEEPSKLGSHLNLKGDKMVRPVRRGSLNNQYVLKDLIVANPEMDYDAFMDTYGGKMPTVTRKSFNFSRCILRKKGYDLPKFAGGPVPPDQRRRVVSDHRYLDTERKKKHG